MEFPDPFDETKQGQVDANGDLVLTFGPPTNQKWTVTQISIDMPTAPAGSQLNAKKMGNLIAPAFSARRAVASGDPPVHLHGGETMTVEWEACTTGDIGRATVTYRKATY